MGQQQCQNAAKNREAWASGDRIAALRIAARFFDRSEATQILSESKAWEIYRERQRRFASLIGDREPIVLHKEIPGMGRAKRYIITIASDDRAPLDKLCQISLVLVPPVT